MRVRSLFLSDIHLGSRACKAQYLSSFLDQISTENLYLIGDTIDFQRMRNNWFWPEEHQSLLQKIYAFSQNDIRVCYIPGNHDEPLRGFTDVQISNFHIQQNFIHTLADGRRFLLMHGDEYDFIVRQHPVLAAMGAHLYEQLTRINRIVNVVRDYCGCDYWSLASAVKERNSQVKHMVQNFKEALRRHARNAECDGIIAGHIHVAEIDENEATVYCNSGDWVESCTAIVEELDGQLRLVRWNEMRSELKQEKDPIIHRLMPFLTTSVEGQKAEYLKD